MTISSVQELAELGLRPLGGDELLVKALENAVERRLGKPPAALSVVYSRAGILEAERLVRLRRRTPERALRPQRR